jgi:hypothetical protein
LNGIEGYRNSKLVLVRRFDVVLDVRGVPPATKGVDDGIDAVLTEWYDGAKNPTQAAVA